MTTPDFFTVEWSPTRGAAIVRDTNGGEYPYDECDEAAHQLLACGNLARRINNPPAKRTAEEVLALCRICGHGIHSHGHPDRTFAGPCRVDECDCKSYREDRGD